MCNSTTLDKKSCESHIIDIICISSIFIFFVGILLNIYSKHKLHTPEKETYDLKVTVNKLMSPPISPV